MGVSLKGRKSPSIIQFNARYTNLKSASSLYPIVFLHGKSDKDETNIPHKILYKSSLLIQGFTIIHNHFEKKEQCQIFHSVSEIIMFYLFICACGQETQEKKQVRKHYKITTYLVLFVVYPSLLSEIRLNKKKRKSEQ